MQEKVEIANEVAKKISSINGVHSANVDDYNKFGSFQVVAVLELNKNKKPLNKDFNLRKINAEIKKILREEKSVSNFGSSVDSPTRVYDKYNYRGSTYSTFVGYEKDYIMIDFVVVEAAEQVRISELFR